MFEHFALTLWMTVKGLEQRVASAPGSNKLFAACLLVALTDENSSTHWSPEMPTDPTLSAPNKGTTRLPLTCEPSLCPGLNVPCNHLWKQLQAKFLHSCYVGLWAYSFKSASLGHRHKEWPSPKIPRWLLVPRNKTWPQDVNTHALPCCPFSWDMFHPHLGLCASCSPLHFICNRLTVESELHGNLQGA